MTPILETGIRIPYGIARRSCESGFVDIGSGIVELQLATGEKVWTTALVGRPVAVSASEVFALRVLPGQGLQLIGIGTSRPSEPFFTSDVISIAEATPSWLDSIEVEADGPALLLRWVVRRIYKGGAPPPEQIEQRESGVSSGAVRVDVSSGKIDTVTTRAASAPTRAPGELEMSADGTWRTRSWSHHGRTCTLVLSAPPSGQQSLAIEVGSEADGKSDTVAIAQGTALVATVSLDLGHVLVRDDGDRATAGQWQVFSLAQLTRVATVTYEQGGRDPSICGGRLLYVVKRIQPPQKAGARGNVVTSLRSRELVQDRVLWDLTIREEPSTPPRLRP